MKYKIDPALSTYADSSKKVNRQTKT